MLIKTIKKTKISIANKSCLIFFVDGTPKLLQHLLELLISIRRPSTTNLTLFAIYLLTERSILLDRRNTTIYNSLEGETSYPLSCNYLTSLSLPFTFYQPQKQQPLSFSRVWTHIYCFHLLSQLVPIYRQNLAKYLKLNFNI